MSLVVVGSGSVRQLLAWLERYDEICNHPVGVTNCFEPNDSYCLQSYRLSTKYYDAIVRVVGFDLNDSNVGVIREEIASSEGLVIVVDKSCVIEGDQSALASLLALGESTDTSESMAIRLLLEIAVDDDVKESESTNGLLVWSLDNAFEYISVDPSRLTETCNLREKDGLPRLVEALQSTMWSTLIRKAAAPPAAIAASTASAPSENVPAPRTEDIMDEFSDLVDKARQFHATAKAGGMGDEERKRVAAETALRLASLLGLDDDDDDDDDT